MKPIKVLFITTSHDKLGDTKDETGAWLEEIAAPYYVFKEAFVEITFASPKGGPVPLDPKSQSIILATFSTKRFLKDEEAMKFLTDSSLLDEVTAQDFDIVFIPGGHGPMWDIAGNSKVKRLLEAFNIEDKPIGAVCHGVVGLLSVQNGKGELLVKDKLLTSFSNSEEESSGLDKVVPFLLETALRFEGASYSKGPDYAPYVVVDGNIITGQNPASSKEVAKKLLGLAQLNRNRSIYPIPSLS